MHSSWRLRILVIVINNKDVIINDNKRMSLLSSTTRGQQERDCTIIYNFVSDGDGDDDDREVRMIQARLEQMLDYGDDDD